MLKDIFFEIQSITLDESATTQQKILAVVSLQSGHPIYKGHFPKNPVVPGVCQIQMIKEIIESAVKQTLILREADNIKFLSMINPLKDSHIEFEIIIKPADNRFISVSASIGSGVSVFLKFKGKFEFEA